MDASEDLETSQDGADNSYLIGNNLKSNNDNNIILPEVQAKDNASLSAITNPNLILNNDNNTNITSSVGQINSNSNIKRNISKKPTARQKLASLNSNSNINNSNNNINNTNDTAAVENPKKSFWTTDLDSR